MSLGAGSDPTRVSGMEIRVRGRVQGVGFRPTIWRLARELGLSGEVLNDAEGVVIRAAGDGAVMALLIERLRSEAPPLADIERIDSGLVAEVPEGEFRIAASVAGTARTQVAPDAAVCPACAREVLDPQQRRHGYPFANCTHCGPRFSIITGIPYDRDGTTMAPFAMCDACSAEYCNPLDRRFHAEAIACAECGPRVSLVRLEGTGGGLEQQLPLEDVESVGELLLDGRIVALKGLGGYQIVCDATNAAAVSRLRLAKMRDAKPFALMARDLGIVRRYCRPNEGDERQLRSSEGPIVLMRAAGPDHLPDVVAPGLRTLGFMLPTTPLHLLALRRVDRPVVMTSGNLSDGPQIIDDEEACRRLGGIADYALVHDRAIASRIDDSVVRVVAGASRMIRRARGFVPAPIRLPAGFESAPDLLALGGELKSTFCLLKHGQAILSHHQGDLEDAATFDDFRRSLSLYAELFAHVPHALVADLHPEYLSSKLARERAETEDLPLIEVQHHHAHVAACLAEHGRPLAAPPVLGIVLDGLGWGADGAIWGGEFLLADYMDAERLGTMKPIPMLGGAQAAREPWRNLYAHIVAGMGWEEFAAAFPDLEICRFLAAKPRPMLDAMLRGGINAPRASSCGRLFDAVAAALGVCLERQSYEGEAACRLESLVDEAAMRDEDEALAYPFTVSDLQDTGLPCIEPLGMWQALMADLLAGTPAPVVAARFHKGLAQVIVAMTQRLAGGSCENARRFDTVALSGGCFHNEVMFGDVVRRLEGQGFAVLSHSKVPANDGGLALGQAAVAAVRLLSACR